MKVYLLSPRPMLHKSVLSLIELGGLCAPFHAKQQNFIVHFDTFLAFVAFVWEHAGKLFLLPKLNSRCCSDTILRFTGDGMEPSRR